MRRIAPASVLAIVTCVLAGCSGAADDAPDIEIASTVTPQRNCRLDIEKTFAAENASLTEICIPAGGGRPSNHGAGSGAANDDLSGELEWKAKGFAACVQGCSGALGDCLADGRQTGACGYVSTPTAKVVPGGVAVQTDRVPLPPAAGEGACIQTWHAQCQFDHRTCIDQCTHQL